MALDDVGHVEAVSLIRRLAENPGAPDPEAIIAARNWLEDHHPSPEAYVAAARSIGQEFDPADFEPEHGGVSEDLRDDPDGMGG